MTASGSALDDSIITGLKDVATGIAKTVLNVAPNIMLLSVGVFGTFFVVNKISSWFKRFLG